MNDDARALAAALLRSAALPPKAAADALYIAVATVNAMDFLLTWNCTHIANAIAFRTVARVCTVQALALVERSSALERFSARVLAGLCTSGLSPAWRETHQAIRMQGLPLLEVLKQFVEVIADFVHHFFSKLARISNNRIFVHGYPSMSSSGVQTVVGSKPISRQASLEELLQRESEDEDALSLADFDDEQ